LVGAAVEVVEETEEEADWVGEDLDAGDVCEEELGAGLADVDVGVEDGLVCLPVWELDVAGSGGGGWGLGDGGLGDWGLGGTERGWDYW
jgi:hypothetical protein